MLNDIKLQEKIRELKLLGRSNKDIALELNLTKSRVWRFLAKMGLRVKKQRVGGYKIEKFTKLREQYRAEGKDLAKKQEKLHIMGCMLYWAEGNKSGNSVKFTNCDKDMLILFKKFLLHYYPNCKILISINYYETENLSYDSIREYWKSTLGVVDTDFRYQTKRNIYYNPPAVIKYPYGIVRITVHSTHILNSIYGAIEEYSGKIFGS